MSTPVTTFVCPGQGPHTPEMLQPFYEDSFFIKAYPLVCTIAGVDIIEALEHDGKEFVRRNEIASLLTVFSTALVADRAQQNGITFQFAAGYSVGQWAAMHLAQMISFEQLLQIVWRRAQLMNAVQDSRDGAMLAVIGVATNDVSAVCEEVSKGTDQAVISNYNAPGQLTLAGTSRAIDAAERLLAPNARIVSRIDVSGAWHCWLLTPAIAPFAAYLQSIELGKPLVPVVDNVTGEFLPSDNAALCRQLALQLASPVMWQKSVQTLISLGTERFVEVGYGNMLTKFGFFIDRKVKHLTCDQLSKP